MRMHYAVVCADDNLMREEVMLFHDRTKALQMFALQNANDCDCYYCDSFTPKLFSWSGECILPTTVQITSETKGGSDVSMPVVFVPSITFDGLTIPSCEEVWDRITGLEEAVSQ